jgi:putative membrane protein
MWMAAIQQDTWWCPMCGWHGGWGMVWMWVFWLVVIVGAVAAVVALLRRTQPPGDSAAPRPSESAEATIRRRYAAGEIDRETYRQMMDDIGTGDR